MKKRIVSKHTQKLLSVLLASVMLLVSIPMTVVGEGSSLGQIGADDNAQLIGPTDTFYEDVSMRDEFSKHYVLESGERYAVIFPEAVHYEEDGEWKEVDNRLTYNSLTGKYVSANPKFTTTFAANAGAAELVSISHDEYTLSWGISFSENSGGELMKLTADASVTNGNDTAERLSAAKAEQASLAKAAAETNQAFDTEEAENVYKNTVTDIGKAASAISYGGSTNSAVSIRYSVAHGKVEEDIILRSKSDFTSYTMTVNTGGLLLTAEADGSVIFKTADGETVFTIDAPWMKDSAYGFSKDIAVTVTQTGNTATITYTPSAAWLNSEDRVYPVLIDPTISMQTHQNCFYDTHILAGDSDFTYYDMAPTLYVGLSVGGEWTSYIKLNYFPDFNDQNVRITDGNLIMANNYNMTYPLNLYETTSRWHGMTNISPPSITPLCGDIFSQYDEEIMQYKYYFDLGLFFENINDTHGTDYDDYISNHHYGFMIKSFNTSSADDVTILDSANSSGTTPMLTITYTVDDIDEPARWFVNDGVYNIKPSFTSMYMTVYNGLNISGTNVCQLPNANSSSQAFSLVYCDNGKYKIKPLCGSADNAVGVDLELIENTEAPVNVQIYADTDSNSANIEWNIELIDEENFKIVLAANPDWALTLAVGGQGTADGILSTSPGNIIVNIYNDTIMQRWNLLSGNQQIRNGDDISKITEATLSRGASMNLNCVVNEFGSTVTWLTSDSSIASIDNGVIDGLVLGEVTVTATIEDLYGEKTTKSLTLRVVFPNAEYQYFINANSRDSMQIDENTWGDVILSQHCYSDEQAWILTSRGEYYEIQSSLYSEFLAVPQSFLQGERIVIEYVSVNDCSLWKLIQLPNGNYKIQSKYHENTNLVIAESGDGQGTIVLKNYTADDDYSDEWIITSLPQTLHIDIFADAAYRYLKPNYISYINSHMSVVKEFFLEKFNILIEYEDASAITSYADECGNTPCTHASNDECEDSTIGMMKSYHHTNINNVAFRITRPNTSQTTSIVFSGHHMCREGSHVSSGGSVYGRSLRDRGVAVYGNILNLNENLQNTIIIHEILHWYGADDHYSSGATGDFNDVCMFGYYRENSVVTNDFVICQGCLNKILQNIDKYDH